MHFTGRPVVVVVVMLVSVTGHLSEGSFVRNVVVQIPKFDAKPNTNPSPNLTITLILTLVLTLTQSLALALTLTVCLHVSDKWSFAQVNCYPHLYGVTILQNSVAPCHTMLPDVGVQKNCGRSAIARSLKLRGHVRQ